MIEMTKNMLIFSIYTGDTGPKGVPGRACKYTFCLVRTFCLFLQHFNLDYYYF